MSFSGFVFDMIGRDKANREVLKLRRERIKDLNGKLCKPGKSHPDLNISLTEFERIQKQTKEKERQEQDKLFRYTCISVAVLGAVSLLIFVVFKLFL